MDALSQLDVAYASKIDLLLTVKQEEHREMYEQLKNFHSVTIYTGYTHDDFEKIFENAHLSIVPVLWEDNLPQIAIESVAYGVPVLSSSAGGASSELSRSKKFIFRCGDKNDFIDIIKYFIDNPNQLKEYWESHEGLVTLKEHVDELFKIYNINCNSINLNAQQWKSVQQANDYLGLVVNSEKGYIPNQSIKSMNKEIKLLYNDIENLKKEKEYLQYCLDETRKSKTYKVGRILTYVPRKLRKL